MTANKEPAKRKNLSPTTSDTMSPLTRLLVRGHQKVGYKEKKGRLLMQFSEKDHRRIAQLIAKWLEDSENQR
ncbi:hypothetical protein [Alteromonas antoniana]|uniref:hypothetical protein n=1 Tax=Alteromonas antoniana TaxID=2803813 RepID=UPI001C4418FB|nr:hypothetical protein [Alteromonas antoniana]